VAEIIGGIADAISIAIRQFYEWIIGVFTTAGQAVWNGLVYMWDFFVAVVQSTLGGFISWARDRVTEAWEALKITMARAGEWIAGKVTELASSVLQGFGWFTSWALDVMETAWKRFYEVMRDFGNSVFANSLAIVRNIIVVPLWGLFETILNKIREKLLGALMITTVTPTVVRGAKLVARGKLREGLNTIIFGPIAGGIAAFILYGIMSMYVPQNPIKLPEIFPEVS